MRFLTPLGWAAGMVAIGALLTAFAHLVRGFAL